MLRGLALVVLYLSSLLASGSVAPKTAGGVDPNGRTTSGVQPHVETGGGLNPDGQT